MPIKYNESRAEQAYRHLKAIHRRVNSYTLSIINQISNGCLADKVIEIGRVYSDCLAEFAESESVPGVAALARSIDGADYDVVAEHNAIKIKMTAVQNHIFNTIPKQNGYLLIWQLNADFTTTVRSFTAAQISALITLLQDVIT